MTITHRKAQYAVVWCLIVCVMVGYYLVDWHHSKLRADLLWTQLALGVLVVLMPLRDAWNTWKALPDDGKP